jgi:tRNA pseudouridine synthase 9
MGLVIVAPEGKPAETVFTRMSYDEERDQSVVHCKPLPSRRSQS